MGGVNHQPCNEYLAHSTELSRSVTLAHSEVHLANVALEDLILAEIRGEHSAVGKVIEHLARSDAEIVKALSVSEALRERMEALGFVDLCEHPDTLDAIGDGLVHAGLSESETTARVGRLYQKGGFRMVLDHHKERLNQLREATSTLSQSVANLSEAACQGEVNLVLEENRLGNIKVEFAVLYTSWLTFLQEFLASSLISTELWYKTQDHGSLFEPRGLRAIA